MRGADMTKLATYLSLPRLFAALDSGARIEDIMRDAERRSGWRVVIPGDVPWLPVEDWAPSVVVSTKGCRVRLVAILSLRPGSLRRLLAALRAADLMPEIVEPTREMRWTLKRWGWRRRDRGAGLDQQEIWSPK
jgi:hypothetical protein